MVDIGFVGLGHMGLPMAVNLVQAGHHVLGYDLKPSLREEFLKKGGKSCEHLSEVAQACDVIITMLQTGDQVKQVCSGPEGLFSSLKSNSLYIDCSSIDVESSREIHQAASDHHILVVDAPVSGGVAGAEGASLTIMVGGSLAAFEAARPVLEVMGKNIIHTGEAGSGQAAKICNNMILGISMIAVSEAFTLADHLGLDAKKLFEVVNKASGQCWVMSKYTPVPGLLDNVPANRDYEPGFTADMMLKDLKLSQRAAGATDTNTRIASKATAIYQEFVDKGQGHLDFSAIIKGIQD